ncbi:glucosamine-6-phosphate deaminase [Bacillus sp. CMF12]|uniref:glucosamine-6-phosphate deaminase n=1 Tax=Bacillaceae TaxID=186817 RepID=UPI001FB2E063|nr:MULTISPECIES: glucosamine-6-phosphate deaminase [Bacillaceae]UOE55054.1 glucosamine-6-phosphate deaminase [Cytobacillus oceanisediminis]USK49512.1 glucosamine-6-phosphate deaminase [Bacillus sp. CMF12]
MKIIRTADYNDMSQKAAQLMIEKIRQQPDMTLGLATGSTPKGVYAELIKDHQKNGTSYEKITTINLDEYIGLPPSDPNSYRHFMNSELFDHLDIRLVNTHLPNGAAEDMSKECERYEQLIKDLVDIDLQLLGIGRNGHIGFNEPCTSFHSRTHVVDLAESTRKANARFFSSIEDVPAQAITMGIASILDSREIILLASGSAKAEALRQLVYGEPDEQFPASALKLHANVTIIADEEALSLVSKDR